MTYYPEIVNELDNFLTSNFRNKWIKDRYMEVYVRKSQRFLDASYPIYGTIRALDIATITVCPDYQRQGKCAEFIRIAHEIHPFQATFIECVSYSYLKDHLLKNGYLEHSNPDCFIKLKLD